MTDLQTGYVIPPGTPIRLRPDGKAEPCEEEDPSCIGHVAFDWQLKCAITEFSGADVMNEPKKKYRLCLKCGGTGKRQEKIITTPDGRISWKDDRCEECGGTGKIEIKSVAGNRPNVVE